MRDGWIGMFLCGGFGNLKYAEKPNTKKLIILLEPMMKAFQKSIFIT